MTPNIVTIYEIIHNKTLEEGSSLNFMVQCHLIVQVIGKTIAATKPAKNLGLDICRCSSMSSNSISSSGHWSNVQRQSAASNPVPISSFVISENETSMTQVAGIEFKMDLNCSFDCSYLFIRLLITVVMNISSSII